VCKPVRKAEIREKLNHKQRKYDSHLIKGGEDIFPGRRKSKNPTTLTWLNGKRERQTLALLTEGFWMIPFSGS